MNVSIGIKWKERTLAIKGLLDDNDFFSVIFPELVIYGTR